MQSERDRLLLLEDVLGARVVGQPAAVTAVTEAVQRSRAGLADPNKPLGSFMFMGPTGVGKTELCKALASFLFDSEDAMVRIDMSEYMEKFAVSRLLGAPPGYVGYEEGGQLTEAVRRRPYTVVLLDEMEKAHADVFNVLLQILDDGRVTDSQGRTVSFANTVIIMTSNLGSTEIMDTIESMPDGADRAARYELLRERVMGVAQGFFRPEFINRVDEFVVFEPLQREQMRDIVKLQADRLAKRIEAKKMSMTITDAALDHLSEVGYDVRYGARPVKRVIQQRLETPLAQALLRGDFAEGDGILVDFDDTADESARKVTFVRLPGAARVDDSGSDSDGGSSADDARGPSSWGAPATSTVSQGPSGAAPAAYDW
uniref:Clp ATPase C-terminal domain-containing protein n=1 Tax=Prasinoderma coloniale TaxID=156133 RepID=A0A7R9TEG1_9VIRI|mmetsp:Transcript_13384/g.56052  ORF Transcript_13384/g.56052 Transcript_13384/m.56052 type:complete len:372 (+) Transcript_13384:586-1701(+)